jgi:predicted RNA-binding Zn ribbon-like protein
MVKNNKIDNITICGGSLCIDFVNTVKNRVTVPLADYLSSFEDLLYWSQRMEIISPNQFRELNARATNQAKEAELFFKKCIAYREVLFELLLALSKKEKVPAPVLETCNLHIETHMPYIRLKQSQNGFEETWAFQEDDFRLITAPIVNDCYELLISDKLDKLKECPKCGWIFSDTTKNGKRRW